VAIWAYCLMPNHVHIIAVPEDVDGLRRTFRFVHRHYTGYINARLRTTGHLWQRRFSSTAVDEEHLHHAFRYIALNPVRARLVERAEDWRWSSTSAHLAGADDHVVKVAPVLGRVGDFAAFLGEPFDEAMSYAALRKAESIGRPIGSQAWLPAKALRAGSHPLRSACFRQSSTGLD
jgi:putative transposase